MSTMSYKPYMYSYIICEANFRVKKATFFKFTRRYLSTSFFSNLCTAFYYGKKTAQTSQTATAEASHGGKYNTKATEWLTPTQSAAWHL